MGLILFVDTETCGIPNDRLPDDHEAQPPLVQLGCLLVDEDNGAEWATLELIVRPNGYTIPSEAAKVHGITTALAEAAGVPLSLVIPAYVHLRARASKVVAHNAEFDLKIMRQAIARNGKPVSLPGPVDYECTADLATPILNLPPTDRMVKAGYGNKPKRANLMEAHEYFLGEKFEGAHGALADVRACARVYFEIKRRASEAAKEVA